jgi:hypothetical protein
MATFDRRSSFTTHKRENHGLFANLDKPYGDSGTAVDRSLLDCELCTAFIKVMKVIWALKRSSGPNQIKIRVAAE